MTLFELIGWILVVAAFAGVGWLVDGERGAGLASLAAPIVMTAMILRGRRDAEAGSRDEAAWEPQARWMLTRGEALVEAWSRGTLRAIVALGIVFGLPGAIALILRWLEGPPISVHWRWGALVIACALVPFAAVMTAGLVRAVAALRNRERSARWSNSELIVRMAGGDWSAPRQRLSRSAWRDVMIIAKDGTEDVVVMPIDIATRAGLARETAPHGPSLD